MRSQTITLYKRNECLGPESMYDAVSVTDVFFFFRCSALLFAFLLFPSLVDTPVCEMCTHDFEFSEIQMESAACYSPVKKTSGQKVKVVKIYNKMLM